MAKLIIHQEKITDNQELVKICPFGAMEEKDGKLSINAACKMCRLCVKKGPEGAVEYVEDTARPSVNKEEWKGIAVYVDHVDGKIHPVTLELLGKARELAQVTGHPVYAVFMGNHISERVMNCCIMELTKYSYMTNRNWSGLRSNHIQPFLKILFRM